jgi:transcription termination factor NusB
MPTRRRQARILALQTLYEADVTGHEPSEILERLLRETDATKEIQAFARGGGSAVDERERLDEVIVESRRPGVEQMATIVEYTEAQSGILLNNRTPVAAINEAVGRRTRRQLR